MLLTTELGKTCTEDRGIGGSGFRLRRCIEIEAILLRAAIVVDVIAMHPLAPYLIRHIGATP